MGTILVREALERVSKLLGDFNPQFHRYPERELVDWWNDAQLATYKFLPSAGARVDAIRLVPGTRQSIESIPAAYCLPGDGSTPVAPILGISLIGGVMRNMGANGATPGKVVRITDRRILDETDPDWHTRTAATAVKALMSDPNTPMYFYVTPPVHASTQVWLELPYIAQPLKVPNTGTPGAELYLSGGASTETIKVRDEFSEDCINYVVARANMKKTDWADADKATYFANLWLGSINGKVAALTGANPNLKRLPFAPEPVGQAA